MSGQASAGVACLCIFFALLFCWLGMVTIDNEKLSNRCAILMAVFASIAIFNICVAQGSW